MALEAQIHCFSVGNECFSATSSVFQLQKKHQRHLKTKEIVHIFGFRMEGVRTGQIWRTFCILNVFEKVFGAPKHWLSSGMIGCLCDLKRLGSANAVKSKQHNNYKSLQFLDIRLRQGSDCWSPEIAHGRMEKKQFVFFAWLSHRFHIPRSRLVPSWPSMHRRWAAPGN